MTTTKIKATTKTVTKRVETVSEDLPSNPFSFEVLNLVSKQSSNVKKIELLKKSVDQLTTIVESLGSFIATQNTINSGLLEKINSQERIIDKLIEAM